MQSLIRKAVMEYLSATIKLMFKPFVLKYYLWLTLPTIILYLINSGKLFIVFFIAICLVSRSAKIGGLLGWFMASLTISIFYSAPKPNHFIEEVLRVYIKYDSRSSSLRWHNRSRRDWGNPYIETPKRPPKTLLV